MGIFLTADSHFGHAKVAESRGFDSVEAHDDEVVRRWNKQVQVGEIVWHLGDVAMGGWTNHIQSMDRLNGTHHLILGNHDRAHPLNSRGQDYTSEFMEYFDSVSLFGRQSHQGLGMLLSHFPYEDVGRRVRDSKDSEDRFAQWRLRDLGTPLVHGHTHSPHALSLSSLGTPQVCVSLDAWNLKPAPLHDVAQLVRTISK